MSKNPEIEFFGEPIFVYSRAQALEDGELVDITAEAKEGGFTVPVAATVALFADIETIPADCSWQSLKGRLWDVVWMARQAIRGIGAVTWLSEFTLVFSMILYTEEGQFQDGDENPPEYRIKMVSGPGDNGEHVLTLMKPEED